MIVRLQAKRVSYPQDAGLAAGPAYGVPYDLWTISLVDHRPEMIGHSGAYVLRERVIVKDTTEIPDPRLHPRKKHRTWPL